MIAKEVLERLTALSTRLRNNGYAPKRSTMELGKPLPEEALRHARWMAEEAKDWFRTHGSDTHGGLTVLVVVAEDEEKVRLAARWLHFIEGVMWSAGLLKADDLPDVNGSYTSRPGGLG